MKIKDLNPNPRNPRKITEEKLMSLKASLLKYGDLSGFVFNRTTKRLIGGHQRSKVLPGDAEIKIDRSFNITPCKTVAEGHVLIEGERFKYREVEADELWETEALIAANKHGGEWDNLSNFIKSVPELNLELIGFNLPEIAALNITIDPDFIDEPAPRSDPKEKDSQLIKCPNCGVLVNA